MDVQDGRPNCIPSPSKTLQDSSVLSSAFGPISGNTASLDMSRSRCTSGPSGSQWFNHASPPTGIFTCSTSSLVKPKEIQRIRDESSQVPSSNSSYGSSSSCLDKKEVKERSGRSCVSPFSPTSTSLTTNRVRNYDVYIGMHGRKPSLLRFADWLRAELEAQGVSCFVIDRARCLASRKPRYYERAMNASTVGVVLITKKSFKNPYSIEELQVFLRKRNLVPIFFDLKPQDCNVSDIVGRRGDLWGKDGGELWMVYGGLENEWKEVVDGLSQFNEWNLEAFEGAWRDCVFNAVVLLAARLGRRSLVKRMKKWREKVEEEEFPFPRNENFVGRKNELSELELILFGNFSGHAAEDYFEIKERGNSEDKQLRERQKRKNRRKGKEPVVWKESKNEIELQDLAMYNRRYRSRQRSSTMYGKGVACVSGASGSGKTELLLEFAYRFHQRYKLVLWLGGERRHVRQNYLNLHSLLQIDVGMEGCLENSQTQSFEEREEIAISRVRKELMRNMPYLLVIDNLESEKDWWDHKLIMDLLPRFGSETHVLISTGLPRVMNIEPLKLPPLLDSEALSLMRGESKDYSIAEVEVLGVINEKLGKLTLGLAIVGAILSELPMKPSRLLEIIESMPFREFNNKEDRLLRKNKFFLQILEVCFSIFDNADHPRSLASRMMEVGGWFAFSAIPISLLNLAAHKVSNRGKATELWKLPKKFLHAIGCNVSYREASEAESISILARFHVARICTRPGHLHFNNLIRLYAQKRGPRETMKVTVITVIKHGSISQNMEHMWEAFFLVFGFVNKSRVVKLKVSELLFLVEKVALPLAVRVFDVFSRGGPAVELLRECTDALEAADQDFVAPAERCNYKPICCMPMKTRAGLNPQVWRELALLRANVLETRASLMVRGGQVDIGDDLIRKAIFIRTSIYGEDHPDTVSARDALKKLPKFSPEVGRRHTLG